MESNQNNGSSYTGGSQNGTQKWLNLPLVSAGVDSMAKRGSERASSEATLTTTPGLRLPLYLTLFLRGQITADR